MNYLSVFECLILLVSCPLMISKIEGCFPANNYFQMSCETSTLSRRTIFVACDKNLGFVIKIAFICGSHAFAECEENISPSL